MPDVAGDSIISSKRVAAYNQGVLVPAVLGGGVELSESLSLWSQHLQDPFPDWLSNFPFELHGDVSALNVTTWHLLTLKKIIYPPAVLFMHQAAVRSPLSVNVQTAVGPLNRHHRAPTSTARSRSAAHQPSLVTRLNSNHQCFISLLYFYELNDGKLSSYLVFAQTWRKKN